MQFLLTHTITHTAIHYSYTLQAWVASTPELANTCFPNPVKPLSDGTGVEPLVYADGEPCVTIEGEVNKVCVCVCVCVYVCLRSSSLKHSVKYACTWCFSCSGSCAMEFL
jgi:hypothetical protein